MSAAPRAAVVFAAAPVHPGPRLRARLAALHQPYVVAADAGATTALAFGYQPDLVVGDFDSLDPATLVELQRHSVPIETHPRDKDATDGELALDRALDIKPESLWLLGFIGGPRLDQELANVGLLSRLTLPAVLVDEQNECRMVRPAAEYAWRPEPGEIVSLLAWGGDVAGVRTQGLRWPLRGEQVLLGSTRGVSNEPVAAEARVAIQRGMLLVTRHFPADGL